MGADVERDSFTAEDYAAFAAALSRELAALEQLCARTAFGAGPSSIGLELELNLVEREGRPAPVNREVLAQTLDPRVTLELDRFNLEINTTPELLSGAPFSALGSQLASSLAEVERAARRQGAEVAVIGILPTLIESDLSVAAMTPSRRYRVLNASLKRLRRDAFTVDIRGDETLSLVANDVTLEGANTSLQVHLRAPQSEFVQHFNAALAATGPVLAVSCNSPIFLGRRLWQETRVCLFRQAVDYRPGTLEDDWRPARVSFGHGWLRRSVVEAFAEAVTLHEPLLPLVSHEDAARVLADGGVPEFRNLRLHQSTVWNWNRAIYDHVAGGHVRMELRALPAGPSVPDMVGNVALLVGLTLGLAPEIERLLRGLTFGHARRNFYQAARFGLDAELIWPDPSSGSPRATTARQLFEELVPVAERGLRQAGVDADEIARSLGHVERRVRRGVTGASWQRRVYDRLLEREPRERAAGSLLRRYQDLVQGGEPISAWPDA